MTPPLQGGATFPLRHRLLRLAWSIAWIVLARWTPVPMHGWRRFLLRCFGAQMADTARVYPSATVWYPPNLAMAAHACLGPRVECYCMDRVTLGEQSLVSQGAVLCAGTHNIDDPHFPLVTKPIELHRGAWVAAEAFVGPGVTIGRHAVLGARGVAFSDLEPLTVYAGNPARPIRRRTVADAP